MPRNVLLIAFAGWLNLIMCATADIVWSGDMYQRAYHDLPALDLNQDGADDFVFNQVIYFGDEEIWIEPVDGQVVVDTLYGFIIPNGVPLKADIAIATDLNNPDVKWESAETFLFLQGTVMGNPDYGGFFGDGYLGISFNVEGSTHYGWVEMSHDRDGVRPSPDDPYLYIHGWAWETEANTSIIAGAIPEPSTGILTMIGSLALLQLARSRRRRNKIHQPLPQYRSPKISEDPETW